VAGVLRKGITTMTALKLFTSAYYAKAPTNRSAETAPNGMDRTLQILQYNVRKMDMVQQSLLNDESLKDFSALAISEPYLWRDKESNAIVITPIRHQNWTKMIPTTHHNGRWAIQSMLWIRKDLEALQVSVESADITAAILHLPDRSILIGSIYVPPADPMALQHTLQLLQQLIKSTRRQIGSTRMDIVMAGDFNQHDQL
jgi:hypothetical protein